MAFRSLELCAAICNTKGDALSFSYNRCSSGNKVRLAIAIRVDFITDAVDLFASSSTELGKASRTISIATTLPKFRTIQCLAFAVFAF
jgi:hypothetical protein